MTCWIVLGISLRFHHHVPQHHAIDLVFHHQADTQLENEQLNTETEVKRLKPGTYCVEHNGNCGSQADNIFLLDQRHGLS